MKAQRLIFWLIATIVTATVFLIGKESFTQPGLERFDGKFEEVNAYRNENNTGPVLRIYAVKTSVQDSDLMREYGSAMPHTKYGKTIVFFFSEDAENEIEISPQEPFISNNLQHLVTRTYMKMPMGEDRLTQAYSP